MYFYRFPLTAYIAGFLHHVYHSFASSSQERQQRQKMSSNCGLQRSANGISRLPNLHNNCVYGSLLCYVGPTQAKSTGTLLQGFCLAFIAICLIIILLCHSFFRFLGCIGHTKSSREWEEEGGGHGGGWRISRLMLLILCFCIFCFVLFCFFLFFCFFFVFDRILCFCFCLSCMHLWSSVVDDDFVLIIYFFLLIKKKKIKVVLQVLWVCKLLMN